MCTLNLNKRHFIRTINYNHTKRYKLKYNDYLNKRHLGYIKLNYHSHYNWKNELTRINKFPKWDIFIGKKNTHHLNLSWNDLITIPKEICQLVNLEELYLYNNNIIKLPKELFLLVNLRVLDIGINKLKFISKRISNLINLSSIYIEFNPLERHIKKSRSMFNMRDRISASILFNY